MLLTISERADGYLQFFTVLLLFIFVLVITYFTTRWIANYQKGRTNAGNIEVIETYKITANKFIQIIRTGEKYLVIAIGKDEVTMLTELTCGQINLDMDEEIQAMDFKSILDKVKSKTKEPEEKH